jgi:hypothetical protein
MTVAALLVSAPLAAQGPARFRSGVELVSLTVTEPGRSNWRPGVLPRVVA